MARRRRRRRYGWGITPNQLDWLGAAALGWLVLALGCWVVIGLVRCH